MAARSRALRMSALVSLLMVMGCPGSPTDTTSTTVVTQTITHPSTAVATTLPGAMLTGTISGAGNSPLSGITLTLTDARAIQVPNSGTATSDGSGKFTFKEVPSSSTWIVLGDVNNTRMAGIVKPNAKKTATCTINLFTTLAVSGIQPYFVEDVKNPDRTVYDLRDLPIDKFNALVAAIQNSQPAPDIKPGPKIKDLNATFAALMDKDPAVKAAFDALFQQIQLNALVRQAGGTPDPNATPTPGLNGASPSPNPSSSVSLATPVPTPTPTPTPSGFGQTPTPAPTKNYSAINVTLADAGTSLTSTAPGIQADLIASGGQNALLIPDDTKIHVIAALPGVPDIDPATALGQSVDGLRALSVNGNTVYAIGNVGGTMSVITMTIDASLQATATAKPLAPASGLTPMTHCSGITWVSIKNALVASDPDQHILIQVDPTSGAYTLYGGIAGKSDTPGSGVAPAAGFGLNTPGALLVYNGNIWVCDAGNHRLVYVSTSTNNATVYSGKADTPDSVNGPALTAARYKNPVSIFQDSNKLYVADSDDNTIRIVDLGKNDAYSTTGAKTDNNQFIFKSRMAAVMGGKVYAANGSGKVVKFDVPTLPN